MGQEFREKRKKIFLEKHIKNEIRNRFSLGQNHPIEINFYKGLSRYDIIWCNRRKWWIFWKSNHNKYISFYYPTLEDIWLILQTDEPLFCYSDEPFF